MKEFVDGKYYGEVAFTDEEGKQQVKNDWIQFTDGEFLGFGLSQVIERILPQYYGITQEQQVAKATGAEVLLIPLVQQMAIVKLRDGSVVDTYVRNIRFKQPKQSNPNNQNNRNNNNYNNSNNRPNNNSNRQYQ